MAAVHTIPDRTESLETSTDSLRPYVATALYVIAIAYAFLAGLRTVADFDSGWLLATGRYIVQNHSIPSTEVFSYTAHGAPWIYPALSAVVLYMCFAVGGYAALSWLGALACAGTVALSSRRQSIVCALLAILAVPAIAFRTLPRAELFSTILFAATLAVLWKHFQTGSARLWLLPIFLLFWVNLHLAFVSGLALLLAYAGMEILELPFEERREAALVRLRRAWPWLLAAFVVTVVNPWGIGIYRALWRQQAAMGAHSRMITEWSGVRFNLATLAEALAFRNPNSGFWWLLAAALTAIAFALWKRQFGVAILLTAFAYESVAHIRFQALFAITVALVGGSVLQSAFDRSKWRLTRVTQYTFALVLVILSFVRIFDVVTSRVYLANGEISTFGAGPSWWLPERAADFIVKNRLLPNLFHDYDLGGYVALRLGPKYLDYIDGRAIPFGPDLLEHHGVMVQTPPDSPEWLAEADRRGINTLFYSTARYAGLNFPFAQLCQSKNWTPVYLDDVAIVAVRNSTANQDAIRTHAVDCTKVQFTPPANASRPKLYNFYANSGALLYLLNRDQEAWHAYNAAQALFKGDPNLHLAVGQLLEAEGKLADAESAYRESLRLRPTEVAWYALAKLLAKEHRYPEAIDAVQRSADLAIYPASRYQSLGQLYLFLKQPADALRTMERAEREAAHGAPSPEIMARIFEGQAQALLATGDLSRALEKQKRAVDATPSDARRRQVLDEMLKTQH